jgi:hypothetical protein
MQTASSFFSDQLIKVIGDGLKDTTRKIIEIEINKAQEEVASESGCESLPTEDTLQVVSIYICVCVCVCMRER